MGNMPKEYMTNVMTCLVTAVVVCLARHPERGEDTKRNLKHVKDSGTATWGDFKGVGVGTENRVKVMRVLQLSR
jgi:hypothetical protein